MTCLGKPAMERGLTDFNEYTDEGTCAHAIGALCLTDGSPADAHVGDVIVVSNPEEAKRTYTFRDDMAEPTQDYINAVLARIEEYKLAGAVKVSLFVEQRVPIGHLTGEEGAEGTADAVIVVLWPDGTALVDVGDLKFGRGVEVSAVRNKQLMLYALGTVEKFSIVTDFDRVRMSVYQPRINVKPGDWECTIAELMGFAEEVRVQAKLALHIYNGDPETARQYLTPSDDACRFCKVKASCPALAARVRTMVGYAFGDLAAAAGGNEGDVDLSREYMRHFDLNSLAERMASCDLIEDWIKSIRAEVEARLHKNEKVPGYKLVQGRQGPRAWGDATAAENYMKQTVRLHIDEMYHLKLISPTDAEKLTKAKAKGAERGIGPAQWAKLLPLITRSAGSVSVAPESDRRPAIDPTAVVNDSFEYEPQPEQQT